MQEDNSNAPEEQKSSDLESSPESHPIAEVPASQFTPIQPKRSKKRIVIVVVLLALVLIAGGVFYYLKNKDRKPAPTNNQTSTLPTQPKPEVKQEEVDAALAKFITPTTGETWLATPKKLANQNFFKNPQDYGDQIEYYEVGKRAGNTAIISITQQIGDDILLYEKSPAGAVTLISRPDGDAVYNDENEKGYSEVLNPTIAIDKNIHYDSLTIPRQLDLEGKYKLGKPVYPSLGTLVRPDASSGSKVIDVKKLGGSTLKRTEYTFADTKLTSISYQIQTPFQTRIQLTHEPLEADLQKYQWQTGGPAEDKLHAISRGCGGLFSSVTRSDILTDADVQQVGKSPSGATIYELKDPNNPLLVKAYDEFKEFNSTAPDVPYASISKAEFIKQHAVVLHKDKFNQWLVYVREQLAPAYGCAKPVVYLYPQKQQNVSVRVGADVKISEPLYDPTTGWKNVLASPNGSLVVNGKAYDSLFWEGPGIGAYPSINSGTVVKTSDAKAVIRSQLKQLGLNSKEINDFEVYWQDKLPSKPYTRLTWLTTAELNQLAPLYITPKPDTVIRVFLDYAGLDAPIKIVPQKLTSIPRQGFTVVEWGGLSPKRLY